MSEKTILVTGATGKQGGALIDAVFASGTPGITILAVTRNVESSAAKKLKDRGVKLIKGDLNDVPAIFESAKKELGKQDLWGVFSLQVWISDSKKTSVFFLLTHSADNGGEGK
jgi:nucleoside-diphosphate-sugar epimerase